MTNGERAVHLAIDAIDAFLQGTEHDPGNATAGKLRDLSCRIEQARGIRASASAGSGLHTLHELYRARLEQLRVRLAQTENHLQEENEHLAEENDRLTSVREWYRQFTATQ